uniref:Cytochrome p450 n=1 Tax=Croton stellatopilosus TaxID=431156 RepID=A0A3G2CJV4_9ROSI|nr:cytochrome p450 [Croton stellatopilosus]
MDTVGLVMVALFILVITRIWRIFLVVFWRPYVLTKHFQSQGVRGPKYKLLYGCLEEIKELKKAARQHILDTNSNDITCRVLPHYHHWFSKYGDTVLYWFGTQPRITITDPELAKQILSNKFGFYIKPQTRPSFRKLIGEGLLIAEGAEWVRHRRVLNPAFSMDKLKIMIKEMAGCAVSMLDEWNKQCQSSPDDQHTAKIEMSKMFQELTADIISHTAFGSSFREGREVFETQHELQKCCAAANSDIFIPGTQYLPTPMNRRIWKLDKKLTNLLKEIVENRLAKAKAGYGDDLLGLMVESAVSTTKVEGKGSPILSMFDIIEDCKLFFFAGHETTSNLLTWICFLLSMHKDWQERVREEVLKECGTGIPDADMLSKLKLVNMVLLECLRIYCPAIMLMRKTSEDMKLGKLMIPKDTCVTIPVVKIHRSKEYWGEDANEFNPWRFAEGVSKAAKHPNALLAFAIGPRACIGQNFAMLEAKTALALILQRFSLSLAPEYKHAPIDFLTLNPQYGMPIIVKSL